MNIKLKLFLFSILILLSSLGFADDTDGDGIDDSIDNCVSVSNADQVDTDSDGIGNDCDADDDGDNVIDSQDAFPLNPKYSKDSDGDGLPDKYEQENDLNYQDSSDASLDIDNDGLTALEEFGFGTNHRRSDTDRDTLPDNWELQNTKNPLIPDYVLTNSCFIGDQSNMCLSGQRQYFVTKDNLSFTDLEYDNSLYCGIAEGRVHCWYANGSSSDARTDVPDIGEAVIDIGVRSHTVCALTLSKRLICWGRAAKGYFGTSGTYDQDRDGILDNEDVCPNVPSSNQTDTDGDGLGDDCDADADGNGIEDNLGVLSLDKVDSVSVGYMSDLFNDWDKNIAGIVYDSTSDSIDQYSNIACSISNFEYLPDVGQLETRGYKKYGNDKFACWGISTKEYLINQAVTAFSSLDLIDEIAIGQYSICAISDGELACVWPDGLSPIPELSNPVKLVSDTSDRYCALHDGGVTCWGESEPLINFAVPFTSVDDSAETYSHRGLTCLNKPSLICFGSNYRDILSSNLGHRALDWQSPSMFDYGAGASGYDSNPVHCAVDNQNVKCFSGKAPQNDKASINRTVYTAPESSTIIDMAAGRNLACVVLEFENNTENKIKCVNLWENGPRLNELIEYSFFENFENPIDIDLMSFADYGQGQVACAISSTKIDCVDLYSGSNNSNDSWVVSLGFPKDLFNAKKLHMSGYGDNAGNICVIEQRGVLCWGINNGPALLNPSDIYTGGDYACAMHDLGVKCWGSLEFDYESTDIRGKIGSWRTGICINDGGEIKCEGGNDWYNRNSGLQSLKFYSIDPDGDGFNNYEDQFPLNSAESSDYDLDGIGDNADADDDNDGLADNDDPMPFDTDNDGLNNDIDTDDDSDGIPDDEDSSPLDTDNDTLTNDIDTDDDNDGYSDDIDEMPLDFLEHLDTDGDGIGNNADTDDDGDGLGDDYDAFPLDASDQVDTDADGIGDNADNCPNVSNADQLNSDDDSLGNACDTDDDNDGVADTSDAFPLDPEETLDTDSDGIGNNADTDDDGDGVSDTLDVFPLDRSETVDTDFDGIGNNADTDDDGDNVPDSSDAFPLNASEWADTDLDGIGNNADTDDDGDGVADDSDAFPLDVTESVDTDSDGIGNNADNDDDGDTYADNIDVFPLDSAEWLDTDSDGTGNNADTDDDNDGVLDGSDAFPLDASESIDTDSDGVGNNADTDDDGDSVLDVNDAFPLDNFESVDSDYDGIGNNADTDDDNDGISDALDMFPLDNSEWVDTDFDGIGNNADTDDDGDGINDVDDAYPLNALYSADSDYDGMPDAWETKYGLNPNDASDATSDQDNDGVAALDEFLAGTIPAGSLDIDGNGQFDALTDGLLLLRGMFGLSEGALISGAVASDAAYASSSEIVSRIDLLGDLVDIDGNGRVDALTDGLIVLRYLFGLRGDVLINGVIASDATVTSADGVGAKMESLMPSL